MEEYLKKQFEKIAAYNIEITKCLQCISIFEDTLKALEMPTADVKNIVKFPKQKGKKK